MEINTLKLASLLSNHDDTITKAAAIATLSTEKKATANVAAIGMAHPRCVDIMVKQAALRASDYQIKQALEKAASADPGVAKELASFCEAIGCRLEKRSGSLLENIQGSLQRVTQSSGDAIQALGARLQQLVPQKPSLIAPPPPAAPASAPAAPASSPAAGQPAVRPWYNDPLVWGGGSLAAGWLANHRKRPQREEDK